jgi:hypothetical protein
LSHYAKIENGIVVQVIVAEEDFIATGALGDPANFVQTSYNTHGGKHPEDRPLRMNYAGVGYAYDEQRDAFIPPQPFASWLLNEDTCLWDAPVAMPTDDKKYAWDEESVSWKEVE